MRTAACVAATVAVLLLSCCCGGSQAYIYHLPNRLLGEVETVGTAVTQTHTMPLTEQEMFATGDGPFGTSGEAYIRLSGTAEVIDKLASHSTVINILVFNEDNEGAVGYGNALDRLRDRTICCTPPLHVRGICDTPGHAIVIGLNANNTSVFYKAPAADVRLPVPHSLVMTGAHLEFDVKELIRVKGKQTALITVCDRDDSMTAEVKFDITAEFKNPYGYVPGTKYGYVPAYGGFVILYGLVMLWYSGMLCIHRSKVLPLQLMVYGVVVLGLIEVATWFITYLSKNSTGVPVCDADGTCPPLSTDIMAAAVLNVAKRSVSRVLLLVVMLGYGVVKPRLTKAQTGAVAFLGIAYFGFGTASAVDEANSTDLQPSIWGFPVVLLDLIFAAWIYHALEVMRRKLKAENQVAKAHMYNQLACTLGVFVSLWLIFAICVTLVVFEVIPVLWEYTWALSSFWDFLYFAVLLAVAVIWTPGERTQQYSLYAQPLGNDDDDVAGDVEMGTRHHFSDDDADDDDAFAIGDDDDSDADLHAHVQQANAPQKAGDEHGSVHSGDEAAAADAAAAEDADEDAKVDDAAANASGDDDSDAEAAADGAVIAGKSGSPKQADGQSLLAQGDDGVATDDVIITDGAAPAPAPAQGAPKQDDAWGL